MRREAEIHLENRVEAAEEEAGADEEDAGERYFGNDKGVARDGGGPAGGALVRGTLGSLRALA